MQLLDLKVGDRFRFDTVDAMARAGVHYVKQIEVEFAVVYLFCDYAVTSRVPLTQKVIQVT